MSGEFPANFPVKFLCHAGASIEVGPVEPAVCDIFLTNLFLVLVLILVLVLVLVLVLILVLVLVLDLVPET